MLHKRQMQLLKWLGDLSTKCIKCHFSSSLNNKLIIFQIKDEDLKLIHNWFHFITFFWGHRCKTLKLALLFNESSSSTVRVNLNNCPDCPGFCCKLVRCETQRCELNVSSQKKKMEVHIRSCRRAIVALQCVYGGIKRS